MTHKGYSSLLGSPSKKFPENLLLYSQYMNRSRSTRTSNGLNQTPTQSIRRWYNDQSNQSKARRKLNSLFNFQKKYF
jgi:hypothetical protein